jgi:plasmid maintenance system killer protein
MYSYSSFSMCGFMRLTVFSISVICIVILLVSSGCVSNIPPKKGAMGLKEYRDTNNLFSLNIPEHWTVSVGDAIEASDSADGGITKVTIQPVHLSGKYLRVSAGDIANYLIGKERRAYSQITIDSVRESQDGKVLELTSSFTEKTKKKRAVYSIFVNSPYAIVSKYETLGESMNEKEEQLRAIVQSYRQFNPPPSTYTTQGNGLSTIGQLQPSVQSGGVSMLLPRGWNTLVLPGCSGLMSADAQMPRGIIFLNGLHQSIQPLPQGITPERYVTDYMAQDFSVGGNKVSDVKILFYENADISALNTGGITAKSMRISYLSNGVPCTGSFTVATYQTGVSTAVGYLWGIFSTKDNFNADAPDLLRIFYSIDYSSSSLSSCRNVLNTAWDGANKIGDSLRKSGEQMRQENLRMYEDKQARNDEFLEKFSDSILDRGRVYNPDTGEVYEVDPNFYTYYDINRDQYNYQNMRELQPGEWLKYTPLDGNLHIQ